jgi:adenylate cyclase
LLSELRQRTEEAVKLNQQLEQRVADQVGEIERMGRLRRFLPPQVADLIVALEQRSSSKAIAGKLQRCSATCAASPGSRKAPIPKTLWRSWPSIMRPEIISKYSGTLERYAGDGVMVIFNDPLLVEIRRCRLF